VRQSPHVRVTAPSSLRNVENSEQVHLFVDKFGPAGVFNDGADYYITFPDSPIGHESLDLCAEFFRGFLLHGQLPSYIHVNHSYSSPIASPLAANHDARQIPRNGPDNNQIKNEDHGADNQGQLNADTGRNEAYRVPLMSGNEAHQRLARDSASVSPSGALLPQKESAVHSGETTVHLLHSTSPPGTSSRQDRDDTASSISGRTTPPSDVSLSKRKRCHACRETIQHRDFPVQCSTCPRHYHRRCHSKPVPDQGSRGATWQCRRCLNKGVHPVTPPLSTNSDSPRSAEAAIIVNGRSPAKRCRLGELDQHTAAETVHHPLHALGNGGIRSGSVPANITQTPRDMVLPSPTMQIPSAERVHIGLVGDVGHESVKPSSQAEVTGSADTIVLNAGISKPSSHEGREEPFIPDAMRAESPQSAGEDEANRLVEESFTAHRQGESAQARPVPKKRKLGILQTKARRPGRPGQTELETSSAATSLGIAEAHHDRGEKYGDKRSNQTEMHNHGGKYAQHTQLTDEATVEVPESPLVTPKDARQQGYHPAALLHDKDLARDEIHPTSPVESVEREGQRPPHANTLKTTARRTKRPLVTPRCIKCKKRFGRSPFSTVEICSACRQQAVPSVTAMPDLARTQPEQVETGVMGLDKSNRNEADHGIALSTPASAQQWESSRMHVPKEASDAEVEETEPGSPLIPARAPCEPCHTSEECMHTQVPHNTKPDAVITDKTANNSRDESLDLRSAGGNGAAAAASSNVPDAFSEEHPSAQAMSEPTADRDGSHAEDRPVAAAVETLLSAAASEVTTTSSDGIQAQTPVELLSSSPLQGRNESKKAKRKRTDRTGREGLGNSLQRPVGTYNRLITMALHDTVGHRLQARAIVQWIADNIPDYSRGKGIWENGVKASLSMRRGPKGPRIWPPVEKPQECRDTDDRDADWYGLPPDMVDTVERWDPVLKRPVSPPQERHQIHEPADTDKDIKLPGHFSSHLHASSDVDKRFTSPVNATAASPMRTRRSKIEGRTAKAMPEDERSAGHVDEGDMDIDLPDGIPEASSKSIHISGHAKDAQPRNGHNEEVEQPTEARDAHLKMFVAHARAGGNAQNEDSSDAEPLSMMTYRRSKAPVAPSAVMQSPAIEPEQTVSGQGVMDAGRDPNMDPEQNMTANSIIDLGEPDITVSPVPEQAPACRAPQPAFSLSNGLLSSSLAQLIKHNTQNRDFTAKSLFEEWPAYEPSNQFNREEKAAEIKQRPTRKQMFGKPAMYSKLASNERQGSWVSSTDQQGQDSGRRSSSTRDQGNLTSFSFDLSEPVKHFDKLDDFLGLPNDPLPMLYNQELVFRDGTRENGRLPRAKVYYKTGFA